MRCRWSLVDPVRVKHVLIPPLCAKHRVECSFLVREQYPPTLIYELLDNTDPFTPIEENVFVYSMSSFQRKISPMKSHVIQIVDLEIVHRHTGNLATFFVTNFHRASGDWSCMRTYDSGNDIAILSSFDRADDDTDK